MLEGGFSWECKWFRQSAGAINIDSVSGKYRVRPPEMSQRSSTMFK